MPKLALLRDNRVARVVRFNRHHLEIVATRDFYAGATDHLVVAHNSNVVRLFSQRELEDRIGVDLGWRIALHPPSAAAEGEIFIVRRATREVAVLKAA